MPYGYEVPGHSRRLKFAVLVGVGLALLIGWLLAVVVDWDWTWDWAE